MDKTWTQDLLDFLDRSPTCYHAVAELAAKLTAAGYRPLEEHEPWTLTPGQGYFVVRGQASLAAFRVPEGPWRGFAIAAAHSDSPTFKIREEAEVSGAGKTVRLSVEPYGGGIYRSWLDRPLSVAGRVLVRTAAGVEPRLVNVDRDLLVIPSVAIHMDRTVNKGAALDPAVDLLPLLGMEDKGAFRRLIAAEAGVEEADLVTTELFLYPRMRGTCVGAAGELLCAPRLDDLQCVYGCLQGFLAAGTGESMPVLCVFHNEEVGSGTWQGADSTFLTDVLSRAAAALGRTGEAYQTSVAESFLVSADNAHAVHPAHPEYADKQEFPVLNGGVVVKYNANQHYTTDALSDAVFRDLCRRAEVPVQRYSNRADLPGGSTLGNISTSHLSIPSVDIGLPQLAMHSCCEVAGVRDTEALARVMTAYFSAGIRRLPGGGMALA